jgi:hypothetical protein
VHIFSGFGQKRSKGAAALFAMRMPRS